MSAGMWFRLRVVGNRFASRAQRREMLRTAAVLATILIVYGIVGTMDYADALASEAEAVPVSNRSVISAPPAFSDKHINVQFFSKNSLAMKCQQLNRTRAEHMAGGVMGCYRLGDGPRQRQLPKVQREARHRPLCYAGFERTGNGN